MNSSSYVLPIQLDTKDGDPIVLLHGLGNNFRSWTHVLKKLTKSSRRIIALDLLGFGEYIEWLCFLTIRQKNNLRDIILTNGE